MKPFRKAGDLNPSESFGSPEEFQKCEAEFRPSTGLYAVHPPVEQLKFRCNEMALLYIDIRN